MPKICLKNKLLIICQKTIVNILTAKFFVLLLHFLKNLSRQQTIEIWDGFINKALLHLEVSIKTETKPGFLIIPGTFFVHFCLLKKNLYQVKLVNY